MQTQVRTFVLCCWQYQEGFFCGVQSASYRPDFTRSKSPLIHIYIYRYIILIYTEIYGVSSRNSGSVATPSMQQCTLACLHLGAYRVYYNEGLKTDEEAKCFFAVIFDVLHCSNRGNRGLCCAKYI